MKIFAASHLARSQVAWSHISPDGMVQDDNITGDVVFPSSKLKQSVIKKNKKLYEKKQGKGKVSEREKSSFHFAFLLPKTHKTMCVKHTPSNGNNSSNTS